MIREPLPDAPKGQPAACAEAMRWQDDACKHFHTDRERAAYMAGHLCGWIDCETRGGK